MYSVAVLPLAGTTSTVRGRSLPCILTHCSRPTVGRGCGSAGPRRRRRFCVSRRPYATPFAANGTASSAPTQDGIYIVGDFMTRRELLHVVGPATTVDEALETLVEKRVTGFPVVDDDGKLVGVISDYDLLALDSISGGRKISSWSRPASSHNTYFSYYIILVNGGAEQDTNMFPVVDSTWKTFNEIQKLLSKTNGKVVGDLMTPSPLVVRENTNLEDAVRLLLKTNYRRLPVVDGEGKLIGIITRGDIVRGALEIKQQASK